MPNLYKATDQFNISIGSTHLLDLQQNVVLFISLTQGEGKWVGSPSADLTGELISN